jgi:hypothetical protein
MEGRALLSEATALVVAPEVMTAVLAPIEAKGLRIIGLKYSRGAHGRPEVAVAIRGVGAVATCRRAGQAAGAKCFRSASTLAEGLELVFEQFTPHELLLSDTELAELAGCAHPARPLAQLELQLPLSDLLESAPGSASSVAFCRALRVHGYVHVIAPPETIAALRTLERLCSEWYGLDAGAKEEDCSEYGHVDRKFTGYRQGRYREQLEVRKRLSRAPARCYEAPRALHSICAIGAHGRLRLG